MPEALWNHALETMRAYASAGTSDDGKPGSEALVYFGGVVTRAEIVITGMYRIDHAAQGDRVIVTDEEARWLVRALRRRDEKLIGQLHSHRGGAHHSPGDDAFATSFHEGYLSIVVPKFGTDVSRPDECAVFEHRSGLFVGLDADVIGERIAVYQAIESRSPAVSAPTTTRSSRWQRFVQKLKSTAPKPR
jgi:hypothetical protein